MKTKDVEEILQQIHDLEDEIKDAEEKRDDSISFHMNKIELAKRICETDTREQKEEIERLRYSLEVYYRENPPKRGKSIKFSGGTIAYRKQNPRFLFADEEVRSELPALVDFVRMYYPEYIKTKESVDWATFKTKLQVDDDNGVVFAETGEIIDGLQVQTMPDKFTVTTNG